MNEWDQFGVRVGYCYHDRKRCGEPYIDNIIGEAGIVVVSARSYGGGG